MELVSLRTKVFYLEKISESHFKKEFINDGAPTSIAKTSENYRI
jgi:hypothetical protein